MNQRKKIKIVADEEIPLLSLFKHVGEIKLKPGSRIERHDLMDTDILLVRSVTKVNRDLLFETPIRFIATTAAGINHLDQEWLNKNQIAWTYAKGVNAQAVAEYVIACVAALIQKKFLATHSLRVGIIGLGQIGECVKYYFNQLNYDVFCYDPLRAQLDPSFFSAELKNLDRLDLITLHASLTQENFHLINENFLKHLKTGCILINTARGELIDTEALLKAKNILPCLDVWENEPQINIPLLEKSLIATPHIAGYSLNAKYEATRIIYREICNFFNISPLFPEITKASNSTNIILNPKKSWVIDVMQRLNLWQETHLMKEALLKNPEKIAEIFMQLRKNYPLREEFLARS